MIWMEQVFDCTWLCYFLECLIEIQVCVRFNVKGLCIVTALTSVSFPTQKHFVSQNVIGLLENHTDDCNYRFILIGDHSLYPLDWAQS